MSKFYPLLRPTEHTDIYNRPVYWVKADNEPNGDVLYLHNDKKVKDGMMHIGNPCTTCEFTSLDNAYMAINIYYVAHGEKHPYVRVHGTWYADAVCDDGQTGQTTKSMVLSTSSNDSEPMEFE